MEEIKHKLGDFVFFVVDKEALEIGFGAIIEIRHDMNYSFSDFLDHVYFDGEFDDDVLYYKVQTADNRTIDIYGWNAFDDINDAWKSISKYMEELKKTFFGRYNIEQKVED